MRSSSLALWGAAFIIWGILGCDGVNTQEAAKNPVDGWHALVERQLTDISFIRDPQNSRLALDGRKLTDAENFLGVSRLVRLDRQPPSHLPGEAVIREEASLIESRMRDSEVGAMMTIYGAKTSALTVNNARRTQFADSMVIRGGPVGAWLDSNLYVNSPSLVKDTLKSGEDQHKTVNDIQFSTRTIRLDSEECLSCHHGSKLNDPVGVAVYAVAQVDKKSMKDRADDLNRFKSVKKAVPAGREPSEDNKTDIFINRLHGFYATLATNLATLDEAMLHNTRSTNDKNSIDAPGVFGSSRVLRFVHINSTMHTQFPDREKMTRLSEAAQDLGLGFQVQMFSAGNRSLTEVTMRRVNWSDRIGLSRRGRIGEVYETDRGAAEELGRAALKTGMNQHQVIGDKEFRTRTITLSNTKCLACHTESKLGDPAAIMVYSSQPVRP